MDFEKLIRERFSVRSFQDTPIEEEKLQKILEAGRLAPTGHNYQPQRIYALRSPEALAKIRSITRCAFNAPVVLLFACDVDRQWNNPLEEGVSCGIQDVSIVATHMMLAAWDQGIGSCWVCRFPNSQAEEAFALPENEKAVLLMPMGYAAEGAVPGPLHGQSRPLSELVTEL